MQHGKNSATGGVRRAASAIGGARTESLSNRNRVDPSEAKVFRAHTRPKGACENLVCPLKLLANQQTGGDCPVRTIFAGLQEQGRLNITTELRRFI